MKIDTCMYTCCNFKYICFKVCFQVCFQVCLLVIEGLYSYDTNNIIIQIGYCMILLLLLLIIMNHMIIYTYMIKQFIYDKQPHHQEVSFHYVVITSQLFSAYIANLTGSFGKNVPPSHLVYISLIKVEGLLVPYIVINFDIVNSGTSVQRYAYLKPSTDEIHHFSSITH